MNTIEKALVTSLRGLIPLKIITIKPSSYRFWKAYDGIQRCAELAIAEIFFEFKTLKQINRYKVSLFSIICYSLGGLISCYVVGLLEEMGFFDEVTPVFFSTFATPHVGLRFFKRNLFDIFANNCGSDLFRKAGQQLFLTDSEQLLAKMAHPELKYYKGLQKFQCQTLMANIKSYSFVAFYSSYITNFFPFDTLGFVDIK